MPANLFALFICTSAKCATAFGETTQIRMYYFAGTRLNFQPRDVLASNRNRSICLTDLLKYPAWHFARNILRESCSVDFKDRHRRLFMENVTKIEIDLPQNLKIFLCVSEKSHPREFIFITDILFNTWIVVRCFSYRT